MSRCNSEPRDNHAPNSSEHGQQLALTQNKLSPTRDEAKQARALARTSLRKRHDPELSPDHPRVTDCSREYQRVNAASGTAKQLRSNKQHTRSCRTQGKSQARLTQRPRQSPPPSPPTSIDRRLPCRIAVPDTASFTSLRLGPPRHTGQHQDQPAHVPLTHRASQQPGRWQASQLSNGDRPFQFTSEHKI